MGPPILVVISMPCVVGGDGAHHEAQVSMWAQADALPFPPRPGTRYLPGFLVGAADGVAIVPGDLLRLALPGP